MTICSEQEPSFWMDVHGELGLEDRRSWEQHLAICEACREEKVLATQVMGQIKEALTPPPQSNMVLSTCVDRIVDGSLRQKAPSPVPKHRWFMPGTVFPAFATACLLLIAIGFFSMKFFFPDSGRTGIPVANFSETLQKDDIEVIENIELLEEFETIQQLVQAMEDQNNPPNPDGQIHGEADGGRKLAYG